MKKKALSMILAIAMVVSMFAGLATTASAAEYTGTFALCTDDALTSGKYILVANTSALTNSAASNWGATTAVAPVNDAIVNPDDSIVWTLDITGNTFTLYNEAAAQSIYCSAAKKLAMSATDATTWTATKNVDGTYQIKNDTCGILSLNPSSGFRPYANGYGTYAFALYKLDENALEHTCTLTEVPAVEPTCTEAGNIQYWLCETCGTCYSDAEGTTELAKASTVLAALGHTLSYVDNGDGTHTATCNREGCTFTETVGHTYVDAVCACGATELVTTTDYELITNTNNLKSGDKVILVGQNGTAYYAMSTEQRANNRGAVAVTANVETGKITVASNAGVDVVTLEGDAATGYNFAVTAGYLYTNATSANKLLTESALNAASSNDEWKISIDSASGVAAITNIDTTVRGVMQYNKSSSVFACYGGASQAAVYIYREVDLNACEHTYGDWTVTLEPTCTEIGKQERICSKCEAVEVQDIPALGHDFSAALNGTELTIGCSRCDYAETKTLNTCAEANAYTDTTVVYHVVGIVTYISGRTVYIEDATGGLCVYFSTDLSAELALGDQIYVSSAMTTYSTLPELTPSEFIKVSSDNALPLQEVTLAALVADTEKAYLGERVKLSGLQVTALDPAGNTTLTDGTNTITWRYANIDANSTLSVNDTIDVIAVVSIYNSTYQIYNAQPADVTIVAEGADVDHNTITPIATVIDEMDATKNYDIEGRVLAVVKATYSNVDYARTLYVWDGTGLISVYFSTTSNAFAWGSVNVGDYVHAYGTYGPYKGMHQLANCDSTGDVPTTYIIAEPSEALTAIVDPTPAAVELTALISDFNNTNTYNPAVVTVSGTVTSVNYYAADMKVVISDGASATYTIQSIPLTTREVYNVVTGEFVAGTVYYTEADGVYTEAADLTAFVEGVTYYTKAVETVKYIGVGDTVTATGVNYAASSAPRMLVTDTANLTKTACAHAGTTATTVITAATCTEAGSGTGVCPLCGETVPVVIPALGHSLTATTAVAATCTTDGNIAYWTCSTCGLIFADAAATTVIAAEDIVIAATGHAYGTPADNGDGTHSKTCANCGDVLTEAHNWVSAEGDEDYGYVAPTCTTAGEYYDKCSDCGAMSEAAHEIPALGHSFTYVDNGDGTHTATCTVCNENVNEGHTYVDGICACGAVEVTGPTVDTALTLNINTSALALEGATTLRMCVAVSTLSAYDLNTAYMEVVATRYNSATGEYYTVTTNIPCSGNYGKNYYKFDVENIPAAQLNDELVMTIHVNDADGKEYVGESITYSAAARAHKYVEDAKGAALEKTMINLLRYAGAFQSYFGYNTANLASARITDADNAAYPVTEVVLPSDSPATITLDGATVTNTQKSLNIEGIVGIANSFKLPTDADVNDYRLNVSYNDKSVDIAGSEWVYRNTTYGYKTVFDQFAAAQMRVRALFAVYQGDAQVSDAFYFSIADYVATAHTAAANGNANAQKLLPAFDAMLNYGDAAAAYFGTN